MGRHMLSPEEREEFDQLMYEASHDEDGNMLRSPEIGARVKTMLEDAAQAGRRWAGWFLDDYAEAGCLSACKQWNKRQNEIQVFHGDKLVTKSAMRSIQRADTMTGERYWQPSLYAEMTVTELRRALDQSQSLIMGEQINADVLLRLIKACEDAECETVAGAMERIGTTLDAFLSEGWEIAA